MWSFDNLKNVYLTVLQIEHFILISLFMLWHDFVFLKIAM